MNSGAAGRLFYGQIEGYEMRMAIAVMIALICAGCALISPQSMRVDIATYSKPGVVGKSVYIFSEGKQSLEQEAVNEYLAASMSAAGIRVTGNQSEADAVALISYSNDSGSTVITGSTSSISQVSGDVSTSVNTETVYNRFVAVRFVDKSTLETGSEPAIIYEARAVSKGRNGQVPVYVPAMLKAIFYKYPAGNGEVRTEYIYLN